MSEEEKGIPQDPAKLAAIDRKIGELYLMHRGDVFKFLKAELRLRDEEVEDLVPQAFLKLTRRFHEGTPPENVKSWLFQVARNDGLEYLRKRELRDACALGADGIPSDIVDRDQRDPESAMVSAEVKAVTHEALMGLPELPRQVVQLSLDGLSCRAIGEALSIEEDRVEGILTDSMTAIQDRLGNVWSTYVKRAASRDRTPASRKKLLEVLPRIGENYAKLLLLRHDEGLDVRQLASRMAAPSDEVERDLKRAYELLDRRFNLSPEALDAVLKRGR